MSRMTMMKLFMRAAQPEEQELLARSCGTSRAYLYQISGGFREPGPELAAKLEVKIAEMSKVSNGRLPLVYRTDLVTACAQCSFAQKCLGARAVRAEFEIVTPELLDAEGSSDND